MQIIYLHDNINSFSTVGSQKRKKRGTWGLPWDYQTQQSHYGYLAYGPYLLSNQTYSCPRKHIGAARIGWYWNYASGYQHIAFVWIKKIHYINYANTHSCQLLSKNSITNIVQTWNNCKTKTELVATTGQHSSNKKIASIMYGEYMFQQLLYGQIATTKLNQLQCED